MRDAAIKTEKLSKCYRIGQKEQKADSLSGAVAAWLSSPISNLKRLRQLTRFEPGSERLPDIIWALQEVTFEVNQGEVVGIIGRNGAGKSTLLKILSRITEPTAGRALINGRVASLLEVGTGFHQELTGRENIYLNGAVLGMSKAEINRKFDEIVDFSEIETFLDTPVKHYSSGMKVRLAFAVAAHLEPEILLIDEVLAVGDAQFQKKCLGKMNEVAGKGRTVLFVSHNMGAINALCTRAILLQQGSISLSGRPLDVTEHYLSGRGRVQDQERNGYRVNTAALDQCGQPDFFFTDIQVINTRNPETGPRTGEPLKIRFFYRARKRFVAPAFVISIRGLFGQEILRLSTSPISGYVIDTLYDNGVVELDIDAFNLVGGTYSLDLSLVRERIETILKLEDLVELTLSPVDVYGGGTLLNQSHGIVIMPHHWRHQPAPAAESAIPAQKRERVRKK